MFDKLTYAGHLESLEGVIDDDRVHFVRGDIASRDDVRRLFTETTPTAVVNFAAESHVDRSIDGPGEFVRTNINGTFELLEAARALLHGATDAARRAFRFLHVSTDEVYGSLGPTGFFTETTPYAPNSPYSASKAAADHLVRAYHETFGVPVLLTNCSNNYGPYQFPEKLVPLMILNALDGKPLPIYGQGQNIRDWLHVEDHCAAILRVLEAGVPGREVQRRRQLRAHQPRGRARALRRAGGGGARGDESGAGRRREGQLPRPEDVRAGSARATTCATPSTPRRSRASSASRRPTRSPRAWPPRCAGTSTTRAGARR